MQRCAEKVKVSNKKEDSSLTVERSTAIGGSLMFRYFAREPKFNNTIFSCSAPKARCCLNFAQSVCVCTKQAISSRHMSIGARNTTHTIIWKSAAYSLVRVYNLTGSYSRRKKRAWCMSRCSRKRRGKENISEKRGIMPSRWMCGEGREGEAPMVIVYYLRDR